MGLILTFGFFSQSSPELFPRNITVMRKQSGTTLPKSTRSRLTVHTIPHPSMHIIIIRIVAKLFKWQKQTDT